MNIGMLWYDSSDRTLEQKIEAARDYFNNKYGVLLGMADTCFINPANYKADIHSDINVIPVKRIMPNYFWIGSSTTK